LKKSVNQLNRDFNQLNYSSLYFQQLEEHYNRLKLFLIRLTLFSAFNL